MHRPIVDIERRKDASIGRDRVARGGATDDDVNVRRLRGARIAHQDPGRHASAIVLIPGVPIIGRELVDWVTHHFIETRAIQRAFTREDRQGARRPSSRRADHTHRTIHLTGEGRKDASIGRDRVTMFFSANVDIDIRGLTGARVAHQDPGRHVDHIVPGEPVFGRELVDRKSHQFIETRPIQRTFTREDRQGARRASSCRADHTHRTIDFASKRRQDAITGRDAVAVFFSANVDIDISHLRGARVTHQDPGRHVDHIVPGVPVLGYKLIGGIAYSVH